MGLKDERFTPDIFEPIMEKKDCKIRILGAKPGEPNANGDLGWEQKGDYAQKNENGDPKRTKTMILELEIIDEDAKPINKDAKIRKRFEDRLIAVETHPTILKDSGVSVKQPPSKLYQLQQAFGFDTPYFNKDGNPDTAPLGRTGKPYCPKGWSMGINEEFADAYFITNDNGEAEPKFGVWEVGIDGSREIVAHVRVETYNDNVKNGIKSYKAQA